MQTIESTQPGGPDSMTLVERPDLAPGPGQVCVRVEAAGVNFVDTYERSGAYPVAFPFRPGKEGAGLVEAVGEGVTEAVVGQRVAWTNAPGSYATHVLVPADRTVPLPEGVSAEQAAALLLQGMTAHYLACDTFPLQSGHRCLVHAAAGGVGLLLTQLARLRGASVLAVVSTNEKAQLAREFGAHEVWLASEDWAGAVRAHTNRAGVDVVYDSVGRDTFAQSLGVVRPRGMVVLYGQSSGPVPPLDPQVLSARGSIFLTRPTLRDYTLTRAELLGRADALFTLVRQGQLRVHVAQRFPLAQAAAAHRALEGRQTSGKIVLVP